MFEVKKRTGCTRSGVLSGENWRLATPNVLHPDTGRFRPGPFAEVLLKNHADSISITALEMGEPVIIYDIPAYSGMPVKPHEDACEIPALNINGKVCVVRPDAKVEYIKEIRGQIDLFVLENSVELYENPRIFIDAIVRIREAIGFQSALYLPGIALPNNLALLFYLGADLLDSVRVALLTRQDYFLTCDGSWLSSELKGESCSCAACMDEGTDYETLLRHNMLAIQSELQRVRARIVRGELREFVEYRAKTSPNLVEMLRTLDKEFYNFQEERFPIVAKSFRATTRLSIERPDVVRFRDRIINRYRKPDTPDILLLLPCSARKPYSASKSHGFFRRAIKDSGVGVRVHELIVTSPIGLVPRELELFYPAQHYDIPVTGHWYEDERKMINNLLKEYLINNKYVHIINHMGEDIIDSVEAKYTAIEKPTSDESLANLIKALQSCVEEKPGKTWKTRSTEEIGSVARFQFGPGAEGMFGGCKVRGKYPMLKIYRDGKQLASVSTSSGLLIPTLHSGELLAERNIYCVNIHDFEMTGNLFAVGVKSASPEIRTGDEVAICRGGKLVGTGTAQMSAEEMAESDRGEAVRVRHKVK